MMTERELRDALRDAAPADEDARRRAWQVVQAAYAEHEPRRRRRSRPRIAALALAAALVPIGAAGAAAASAPDSAVGEWVRSVLGVGERDAQPALARVPGGRRLLVQSGDAPWVVSPDGAKRRLGFYTGAAWSPRGLFVIAWRGRELTALDPGSGEVRWSLSAPAPVALARWAPRDGFRIAYLAGAELRVVNGDGTAERRLAAPARPDVAPAWQPTTLHVVAHVDARDRVEVVAVDPRKRLWRSAPVAGVAKLSWSPDGRSLLAATPRELVVFDEGGRRMYSRPMPAGSVLQEAEWAPRGTDVAIVRRLATADRSEVLLLDAARGLRGRVLFTGPGRFGAPAWSPGGERLLIAWPDADQWLFLRPRGGGRLTAVGNIAQQFMPGAASRPFPGSVQWCCTTPAGP